MPQFLKWSTDDLQVAEDTELSERENVPTTWAGQRSLCPSCGGPPSLDWRVDLQGCTHGQASVLFALDPAEQYAGKGVGRASALDWLLLNSLVRKAPLLRGFPDAVPKAHLEPESRFRYYVAGENGRAVGYSMWSDIGPNDGVTLEAVLVRREFRGKGWARRLLTEPREANPERNPGLGVRMPVSYAGIALLRDVGYDLSRLQAVSDGGFLL